MKSLMLAAASLLLPIQLASAISIQENSVYNFSGTQMVPNGFYTVFTSNSIIPFWNTNNGTIAVGSIQNGLLDSLTITATVTNIMPVSPHAVHPGSLLAHQLPAHQFPAQGQGTQVILNPNGTLANTNNGIPVEAEISFRFENLTVGTHTNGDIYVYTQPGVSPKRIDSAEPGTANVTINVPGFSTVFSLDNLTQNFMPFGGIASTGLFFGDDLSGALSVHGWQAGVGYIKHSDIHILDISGPTPIGLPGDGGDGGDGGGTEIPEPTTAILLGSAAVAARTRRRKSA